MPGRGQPDLRKHRHYGLTRAVRNRARGRAATRLQRAYPEIFAAMLDEEMTKAQAEAEILGKQASTDKQAGEGSRRRARAAGLPEAEAETAVTTDVLADDDSEVEVEVILLRAGQRKPDETPIDRIRKDVGDCPWCIQRHDNDHACPICGQKPQVMPAKVANNVRAIRG